MGPRARWGCLVGLAVAVGLGLSATAARAQQERWPPDCAPGRVLVRFRSGLTPEARHAFPAAHGLNRLASLPVLGVDLLASADRPANQLLADLASSPLVEWAEPDPLCQVAMAEPDDPAYHEFIGDLWLQWPLHQLDASAAWSIYPNRYFTAADRPQDTPVVAVVDTGADPAHPDFLTPGAVNADVASGGQLVLSTARTFLAGQPGDLSPDATDEHGHGTHLAGLIAAAANNGLTAGDGIAGLGYPARLLPLKVTRANGVATHADVSRAIIYAADQGAEVILVGLVSETWSQTLQAAVDYAWDRGCFVVAPAGNTPDGAPSFPAACPHVFGVGAATADGAVASYTNRGWAALAGPGGDQAAGVYSTLPTYPCTLRGDLTTPAYGWLIGTSEAAAHVAGAAALYAGEADLQSADPDARQAMWQALQQSATSLVADPSGGWDERCGYGLVAPAALLAGERTRDATVGSIIGRVVNGAGPIIGAQVTAAPEAGGDPVTAATVWPAGGYRLANLPVGRYRVTTDAGLGVWERLRVPPGCDVPAVDFRPVGATPNASLVSADITPVQLLGGPVGIEIVFANLGPTTWSLPDGYQMRQAASERPLRDEVDHIDVPTTVPPGGAATFAFSLAAPDHWGLYTTAWQMCQQGGAGWFGPVAAGSIAVTSFWDVPVDHWAVAEVEATRQAGIVAGYSGDLYHPDWAVSRDQMAVYLARALTGGDDNVPPGPAEASFRDVPATGCGPDGSEPYWAYKHIEFIHAEGIALGYPDGTYRPTETVNRGQMAAFISRSIVTPHGEAGLAGYTPPAIPTFWDVPLDHPYYRHIEYIAQDSVAVTQGYGDGGYHPTTTCNRGMMAVYVQRAFALPI